MKPGGMDSIREIPFIFPDSLVHAEVAKRMTHMLLAERPEGYARQVSAVSAGFMSSLNVGGKGACYGDSESLKLKSRDDKDSILINTYDYLHGVVS